MKRIFVLLGIIQISLLARCSLALHKCCPQGYALSTVYQGPDEKYCVPYTHTNGGRLVPGLEVPKSTKYSMQELLNKCQIHNRFETTHLSRPEQQLTRLRSGEFQLLTNSNTTIILTPDTCTDWMIEYSQHSVHQVVITCPCSSAACIHLCCPKGNLGQDNGPCGASWSTWVSAVHPVFDEPIYPIPEQINLESCLHEGPLGGIGHASLRSTSTLKQVEFDNYLIAGRHLSRSQFCLGLQALAGQDGAVPPVQVYYCDIANSGGIITNNPRWIEDVRMSRADHVTWLSTLAAAITVATLALAALGHGDLPGVTLMIYCMVAITALLALAYAPIAVALPGVFSTPANDCIVIAHMMHFAFLASFLLLTLRVVLIFSNVRSARLPWCHDGKEKHTWYIPVILLLAILILAAVFTILAVGERMGASLLQPTHSMVTINQCWFSSGKWYLILYTLPQVVGLTAGFVLLIVIFVRMRLVNNKAVESESQLSVQNQLHQDWNSMLRGGLGLAALIIDVVAELLCFLLTWPSYWLPFSALLIVRALVILLAVAVPSRVWRLICCQFSKKESSWNLTEYEIELENNQVNKNPFNE